MWFLIPLVKILSEFARPGKGLLVAVEEVLLIWQVAELVCGAHLELVVLQWGQEECAVLKYINISPRLWLISPQHPCLHYIPTVPGSPSPQPLPVLNKTN